MIGNIVGKPLDRYNGLLKVTGRAKYTEEFEIKNIVHTFTVHSIITNGMITEFYIIAVKKRPGVIKILTYQNAPRLKIPNPEELQKTGGMLGEDSLPLQDSKVDYFGQYVALVVAETYEQARDAARQVKVTYAKQPPAIDLV